MTHEAQTRLPWTAEEDAVLISLVERYGEKRWNMVANGLPGRTGKGCSHRWRTYLRPDVKHPHLEPFTEWEAAVIVQAQKEMGNNWLAIAKLLLPGRSNTAVKNFWHCRLKSGSGTNVNRFIVEGYSLRYLLSEVPHEERIHPVALPAFPSTAPTGQLHPHHKHEQQMADLNQLALNPAYMSAAAQDSLTAKAYPHNPEQDGADMDGSLMGLNPAAAGLPAGLSAPAGVPPADPTLDPKEDLKRRAGAYVQQQIAMMGQPAIRNGSGAGSKGAAAAASGSPANIPGMMDWMGGAAEFSVGGVGGSASGAAGFKKGPGRGRGRRPGQRARHTSDDDPNDETYVPSGRYAREEQLGPRVESGRGHRHSEPSAGGSTATYVYMHAGSSGLLESQQMMNYHSISAAGDYQYAIHGMQQHQQQYYDGNHGIGHHHISDGGAVSSAAHYQQHQHQQPGFVDNMNAGMAPWLDVNYQCSIQQQQSGHPAATMAASGDTAAAAHTSTGRFCDTTTAATVAAATRRVSLLGLEDTAVAYEAFRQSGGDFKVSLSCLDELLSGGTGLQGNAFDWNIVGGATHFSKGNSLDGSRLSLTGTADPAAGASQRPYGVAASNSSGTIATYGEQQQYQQLQRADMPPPSQHHAPAAAGIEHQVHGPEVQASCAQQGLNPGSAAAHQLSFCNGALQITASPSQLPADVTGSPNQGIPPSGNPVATRCPTQAAVTDSVRCDSPFKVAALQQQPFSPALESNKQSTGQSGRHSTETAPSSQHTQCSGGNLFSNLPGNRQKGAVDAVGSQQCQQQQQQAWPVTGSPAAQGQPLSQGLPPTFHTVLQALGGAHASSAAAGTGTANNQSEAVKAESTHAAYHPAETATYAVSAAKATSAHAASAAGASMGLQLHCVADNLHRHSRASFNLLSPVGNIFADATDGCMTLDDAMGGVYQSGHTGHESSQIRAERRSLRMLLGMLSSNPGESQQDILGWDGSSAGAAVDAATLNAADDLTYMRRSSHGGSLAGISCSSRPTGSSSGRPSLNILMPSGRTSHRGMGFNHGGLGLGEVHKRPRMSITLTSPTGGPFKRSRVSIAGGVTGRLSSGTAEYDDCMSYWQN